MPASFEVRAPTGNAWQFDTYKAHNFGDMIVAAESDGISQGNFELAKRHRVHHVGSLYLHVGHTILAREKLSERRALLRLRFIICI